MNTIKRLITFLIFITSFSAEALQPPPMSYPFPINHYDQTITDWIKFDTISDTPLLNTAVQKAQLENFKKRFLHPWDDQYIDALLNFHGQDEGIPLGIKEDQEARLKELDKNLGRMNCDPINANYNTPYPASWIQNLTQQVNLPQFDGRNSVQGKGIALDNLNMRVLPTDDRYFHDCNQPGEGDSFDYMQMSALWAGTPVYILGESFDHQWYLIRSPDTRGWVKSAEIKRVSDQFISAWMDAVNRDNSLIAINSAINVKPLAISDEATHTKRFLGYMGAIFPLDPSSKSEAGGFHVLIPVQESNLPVTAYLSAEDASLIPLLSTIGNFMQVMNKLKGRDYGWGSINIENPVDFLNDCSQELKSLYTPFGIWLPRSSVSQVNKDMIVGTVDDTFPADTEGRIAQLVKNANQHRFTTIVYIYGHIFMYLGSYPNPTDESHAIVPLTYQNMWGLRPVTQGTMPSGRYVVGKAVLFPLLSHYPEKYPADGRELVSHAGQRDFIAAYLDQLPSSSPAIFTQLWNSLGLKSYTTTRLDLVDEYFSIEPAQQK